MEAARTYHTALRPQSPKAFCARPVVQPAADVVGGQGERHHKQAHAASGHHVVLGVLDLDLADHGAHGQHAHQICDNDNQGQNLNFHMLFSFFFSRISAGYFTTLLANIAPCNKNLINLLAFCEFNKTCRL